MVMKSTLSVLPDAITLRRKAQSLAVLDAIMSPDWQYRYYSFNSQWDADEMMASRKNGSGDELYVLFNPVGTILKGFDHESLMSPWAREPETLWPQIFDQVPLVYHHEVLTETVVKQLNHDADIAALEPELSSIGYPSA